MQLEAYLGKSDFINKQLTLGSSSEWQSESLPELNKSKSPHLK